MGALDLVGHWPVEAAAGWCSSGALSPAVTGPVDRRYPWASVTKVLTAMAVWVAVEEGTVAWDDEAGPAGSTLAHLLAHASGLAPDTAQPVALPGQRRVYSNAGIEAAADHLSRRAGVPAADYITEAVIVPLALRSTRLDGSPAHGASGSLTDLLRIGWELLRPSLVAQDTLSRATAVAFPGLDGILPGYGPQSPNDWGLGVEVRGHKHPHWTGATNSARTFGHFGQSGSFLWVDPDAGVAAASLAGHPFGPWAARAWPPLSDAILAEAAGRP